MRAAFSFIKNNYFVYSPRQLRCTRVMLHQHLFVSFIVTGLMWIMTYSQFMANPGIRKDNTVIIWASVKLSFFQKV